MGRKKFRRVHSEKATSIAYHVRFPTFRNAQQEWGEDAVDFHMEQVKEKSDEEKAKEFEEYFGGPAKNTWKPEGLWKQTGCLCRCRKYLDKFDRL